MLKHSTAIAAAAIFMPAATFAATFSTDLTFNGTDGFLPGPSFDESFDVDVGIAVVDFGARLSTGTVDADASLSLDAVFDSVLTLAESTAASVGLSVSDLSYGFDTFLGATAEAGVDFDNISLPFLPDIDVPRLAFASVGYGLETEGAGTGFSTTSDTGNEPIDGFGVPPTPLLGVQAELTLDGSQTSDFSIDDLVGVVQATHTSGAIVTDTFSILSDSASTLDLSIAGDWVLELVGVALENTFDTSIGLAASGRVGAGVGVNCGDFSTDGDNGFGCVFDTGAVISTPQLTLIDPGAFGIDFGTQDIVLGNVSVAAAVPLPAGMTLMLAGLGAFGYVRRRKNKATA